MPLKKKVLRNKKIPIKYLLLTHSYIAKSKGLRNSWSIEQIPFTFNQQLPFNDPVT